MADILHKQIKLQKTSPDTYSASWHPDWVLGKSMLTPLPVILREEFQ